jgi:hypothetical protein
MKTVNKYLWLLICILSVTQISCADEEFGKKYQSMRIETSNLIKKANLVLSDQKAKYDSLQIVGNNIITFGITTVDVNKLHNATINTLDVQETMSKLKIYLESISFHCTIIEKASTRFGYLLKGKKKIKGLHSKFIDETNNQIIDLTGGLSAKDFVNKYLPEKQK